MNHFIMIVGYSTENCEILQPLESYCNIFNLSYGYITSNILYAD